MLRSRPLLLGFRVEGLLKVWFTHGLVSMVSGLGFRGLGLGRAALCCLESTYAPTRKGQSKIPWREAGLLLKVIHLQAHLAHKKQRPPGTLQKDFA